MLFTHSWNKEYLRGGLTCAGRSGVEVRLRVGLRPTWFLGEMGFQHLGK